MQKKYDLIFGIGEACSCTESLRRANLQICSFPFDWLYGSDFIGRCKILTSKFHRFIEKNDLADTGKTNLDTHNLCEVYHNTYNDITFNHDFPANLNFQEAYLPIRQKYNRRINRLLSQIENSSKILIVYIETPTANHKTVSDATVQEGYNIIKSVFNKNIDLLYISHSKDITNHSQIAAHITRIIDNYKSINTNDPDYAVNTKKLSEIFKNYRLNFPFFYFIKKKLVKFLISCVPQKQARHNLRKKYHV